MSNSKIVSFGSTRRKNTDPKDDISLSQVLDTQTETVVLFGKSWQLHVKKVLNTTLEENLNMIYDSIRYLREQGREIIFDAEHYFDGFKSDPDYALRTLMSAEKAGARAIVLCDTNGGTLTHDVELITRKTVTKIGSKVGVHCHNDTGLAVANTLAAVKSGVSHIQGTVNGFGERCGNADLCQVIPSLKFKMGLDVLGKGKTSKESLKELTSLSRYVYELTNIPPKAHQPYVGSGAFSHKAGMHVNAILKHSGAYEHIDPEVVGNKRRFLISELAGKSGIVKIASDLGFDIAKRSDVVENILEQVKKLESEGYHLENADAYSNAESDYLSETDPDEITRKFTIYNDLKDEKLKSLIGTSAYGVATLTVWIWNLYDLNKTMPSIFDMPIDIGMTRQGNIKVSASF